MRTCSQTLFWAFDLPVPGVPKSNPMGEGRDSLSRMASVLVIFDCPR